MLPSPSPSPELPPSRWNPLVITVVGTFCAIFLIISYCRILRKQCFRAGRAPLLGNQPDRQLLNEGNPDDPSLQFHSHGLDTAILYSLPAVQFRKKSEVEIGQGEPDCAVCLGQFEEGEWLRYLPNCTHAFHISCIDTWFESHSNCPLCRSHVLYNLTDQHGQSVSMFTLLETLRREDTVRRERIGHHQAVHSEFLRNPTSAPTPSPADGD